MERKEMERGKEEGQERKGREKEEKGVDVREGMRFRKGEEKESQKGE